jgi:hypothetical protein
MRTGHGAPIGRRAGRWGVGLLRSGVTGLLLSTGKNGQNKNRVGVLLGGESQINLAPFLLARGG